MSPCKDEGSSYPILKRLGDFLVKILDFQLILFSFPSPQVPSPPTKVSQNLNTLVVIRLCICMYPSLCIVYCLCTHHYVLCTVCGYPCIYFVNCMYVPITIHCVLHCPEYIIQWMNYLYHLLPITNN